MKAADPLLIDLISKILIYNPKERVKPIEALAHTYFDDLRQQSFQNQECRIPDLFNFTQGNIFAMLFLNNILDELKGSKPQLLDVLVPGWKKNATTN